MKGKTIFFVGFSFFLICSFYTQAKKNPDGPLAKKDIRDYSDADMHKLLEQWEEDDEPLPPDELPEGHPDRPKPLPDFTKMDPAKPYDYLKESKRGQPVAMFVRVNHFKSREETDEISGMWHTGLFNNHLQEKVEKYVMEDDEIMFMFRDGSDAWDAKDFIIEQERCEDVKFEKLTFCGKYAQKCTPDDEKTVPLKSEL